MIDIPSLSEKIFEKYGMDDAVGIRYFQKWVDQLSNFGYFDLIIYQMKNYDHQYVIDFILGTPFLWDSKDANDWVRLITLVDRPDPGNMIDQSGSFADIVFFSRYVGVDVISYIMSAPSVSKENKRAIIRYFKKWKYTLIASELDDEDLDGEYFASKENVISLGKYLHFSHNINYASFSHENIEAYMCMIANQI